MRTAQKSAKKDFAKNSTPVFTLNCRKKLQRFRENRQKLFASVSKGTLDSQVTYLLPIGIIFNHSIFLIQ